MKNLIILGLITFGSISALASGFGESCNLSLDEQEQLFLDTQRDLINSIELKGVSWTRVGLGMTTVAGKECSCFEITVKTEQGKKLINSEYGNFFYGLPMIIDVRNESTIAL